MSGTLEVRVLGELTLAVDGATVAPSRGNEAAIVGLLALNAGRTVSIERITDVIWNESPPKTAREMVRIYVARLRKRIGQSTIETHAGGYRLRVNRDAVDALIFEKLCTDAARLLEDEQEVATVDTIDRALSLWTGVPFEGLEATHFVRDERSRLEQLRLSAIEIRTDAELALGHTEQCVPTLESFVRDHPYRERSRGQLMLALYRSGQQTEALQRFQEGRRLLVSEFGVEPGPELQQMQKAILAHDPALGRTPQKPAARPSSFPGPAPSRSSSRAAIGMALTALAIVAVVALIALNRGPGASRVVARNSVGVIDAGSGTVIDSTKVDGVPGALAVDGTHVWVGEGMRPRLYELDATSLHTIRELRLPDFPYKIVTGYGAVWVANGYIGNVVRVNAANGTTKLFTPERKSTGRLQLAEADGALWFASQDGRLTRLEPHSLRALASIDQVADPETMTAGLGSLWIASATRDELLRIDPGENRIARTIPIGGNAESVAAGDGAIWAVTPLEGRLWRIDPNTDAVTASIAVGSNPVTVTTTPNAIWVGTANGEILRVNPRTNTINETIRVAGPVADLASTTRRVYVTVR
jgi:DNA-binding SARP family transcriptional activator/streptogramin lyase